MKSLSELAKHLEKLRAENWIEYLLNTSSGPRIVKFSLVDGNTYVGEFNLEDLRSTHIDFIRILTIDGVNKSERNKRQYQMNKNEFNLLNPSFDNMTKKLNKVDVVRIDEITRDEYFKIFEKKKFKPEE